LAPNKRLILNDSFDGLLQFMDPFGCMSGEDSGSRFGDRDMSSSSSLMSILASELIGLEDTDRGIDELE